MGNMAGNALTCAALSSPRTMPFLLSCALSGTDFDPPTCALHACDGRVHLLHPYAMRNATFGRLKMPQKPFRGENPVRQKMPFPTPILLHHLRVRCRAQGKRQYSFRRNSGQCRAHANAPKPKWYAPSTFIIPPPLVSRAPAALPVCSLSTLRGPLLSFSCRLWQTTRAPDRPLDFRRRASRSDVAIAVVGVDIDSVRIASASGAPLRVDRRLCVTSVARARALYTAHPGNCALMLPFVDSRSQQQRWRQCRLHQWFQLCASVRRMLSACGRACQRRAWSAAARHRRHGEWPELAAAGERDEWPACRPHRPMLASRSAVRLSGGSCAGAQPWRSLARQ